MAKIYNEKNATAGVALKGCYPLAVDLDILNEKGEYIACPLTVTKLGIKRMYCGDKSLEKAGITCDENGYAALHPDDPAMKRIRELESQLQEARIEIADLYRESPYY